MLRGGGCHSNAMLRISTGTEGSLSFLIISFFSSLLPKLHPHPPPSSSLQDKTVPRLTDHRPYSQEENKHNSKKKKTSTALLVRPSLQSVILGSASCLGCDIWPCAQQDQLHLPPQGYHPGGERTVVPGMAAHSFAQ